MHTAEEHQVTANVKEPARGARTIYRYLHATREKICPFWVTILARFSSHARKTSLKGGHGFTVHHILWKTVVHVDHRKDGPIMQCMLELNIQDVSIELLIMLAWTQ